MANSHAQENVHDTRQLLDELDALMNQMLAVPVYEPDDSAPAFPPSESNPTVSATLTLLTPSEAHSGAEPESALAIQHHRVVSPTSDEPDRTIPWKLNLDALLAAPPASASESTPISVMTQVMPSPLGLAPLPAKVSPTAWAPTNVGYHFLLWVNQGYDTGASWLGAPGRVLGSRSGKAALGLLGVALIFVALSWLSLDWLGW